MFADRREAGRALADALVGRVPADALVLGVPRGGVVVAAEVAARLGLELDIEVVRKIGAPHDPEVAIAAVDADGRLIGAGGGYADEAYLASAAASGRAEIERRLRRYRGERPAPGVLGRTVVLVDDGLATGLTIRSAIESLRARGAARIIVAVPAAITAAVRSVSRIADEVVALDARPDAYAVSQFYGRFDQTSDDEVVALLERARRR